MPAKTTRVYPSPDLSPVEYVPGVGVDGADVPVKEAEAMLASGIVVTRKPTASKQEPKPKALKPAAKAKPTAPDEPPADKSEVQS